LISTTILVSPLVLSALPKPVIDFSIIEICR
jgi:hypothetical protein